MILSAIDRKAREILIEIIPKYLIFNQIKHNLEINFNLKSFNITFKYC